MGARRVVVGEVGLCGAGGHLGGGQRSSQMTFLKEICAPLQVAHDEEHPIFARLADTIASP